ncbi:hypothetical protein ILUMI_10757 [Ignelater luminosus]|uniref:DDE Tnp4 domain-containing protein n=1 Tax=Ignelater luminosus TaxID=2038154 RepID=A0A8K0D6F1_IGNLU|nr:hypothetical protein ILUMI_10757 [Ignelater luminosus]
MHTTSCVNRKGYHSVLLQGICDHNGLFIDVFTGFPGSVHDQMLFTNSDVYTRIQNGTVNFDNKHLIGDKAYQLSSYFMVPFKRTFGFNKTSKKLQHHPQQNPCCNSKYVCSSKRKVLQIKIHSNSTNGSISIAYSNCLHSSQPLRIKW